MEKENQKYIENKDEINAKELANIMKKKYPMMYTIGNQVLVMGNGICRLAKAEELIIYKKYRDLVDELNTNNDMYIYEDKIADNIVNVINSIRQLKQDVDNDSEDSWNNNLENLFKKLDENDVDSLNSQLKESIRILDQIYDKAIIKHLR